MKKIAFFDAKPYDKIELEGYEVLSHNHNFATFKNKEEINFHTKDFFNAISKKYDVVDFSVESISVDEILAKLYTELKL